MKGTLKKLYINLFYIAVIFFIIMVSASIIYYYLFYTAITINLPLPDNKTYPIKFTNYDLIMIGINGIVNDIKYKYGVRNPQEVNEYVNILNNIISEHKDYYLFYYYIFQRIYPKRYFLFCVDDSCNVYFFGIGGFIQYNTSSDHLLTIWIDEKFLNELIYAMERNDSNVLIYFKNGLRSGEVKISNFQNVLLNVLESYSS